MNQGNIEKGNTPDLLAARRIENRTLVPRKNDLSNTRFGNKFHCRVWNIQKICDLQCVLGPSIKCHTLMNPNKVEKGNMRLIGSCTLYSSPLESKPDINGPKNDLYNMCVCRKSNAVFGITRKNCDRQHVLGPSIKCRTLMDPEKIEKSKKPN